MADFSIPLPPDDSPEHRVKVCVSACEGIPTAALEKGIILRLVAACVHLGDSRVREILEEMVPARSEGKVLPAVSDGDRKTARRRRYGSPLQT